MTIFTHAQPNKGKYHAGCKARLKRQGIKALPFLIMAKMEFEHGVIIEYDEDYHFGYDEIEVIERLIQMSFREGSKFGVKFKELVLQGKSIFIQR